MKILYNFVISRQIIHGAHFLRHPGNNAMHSFKIMYALKYVCSIIGIFMFVPTESFSAHQIEIGILRRILKCGHDGFP